MDQLLLNESNKKIILLGNDAIVRGALESGVQFVSTYPGTPASEVGISFSKIAKKAGVYFEFSTNEKVAFEAGVGASFSGLKTLVVMKNFGLNVALEPLLPFVYTGTKGPFVLIIADDPSCHSSAQSEENSRAIANLAHIPILEPSDPQECKDFTKLAFQLSERFKIPVMVRTTTRVSHQKMPVSFGKIQKPKINIGKFVKDKNKFITLPPRVLGMKSELLEKLERMSKVFESLKFNRIEGKKSQAGIITSGISYLHVKEVLKEFNLDLPILKLATFYPLPEKKITGFIKSLKKVLIIEELEPYLEKEIGRMAKNTNCKLKIFGKDLIPEIGELRPNIIASAIAKLANIKFKSAERNIKINLPKRFPQLCPGCSYWLVFGGIKKAVNVKNVIFGGDIGCYMLGALPPHSLYDYLSCMGASIGITHGIRKATRQKTISFIGDSTFFHSGIPALINTVFNKSNSLIIILDNGITAMTGHQPRPDIKIENIVRGCGVKNLKVIDPINQKEFISTVKEFINKKDVSVIITRRPCIVALKKKWIKN